MFYILFVTLSSFLVIHCIERQVKAINGGMLCWWRRMLIPIPMIFFLAANLDGVLSFAAYVPTHPNPGSSRYSEYEAWKTGRFWGAALASLALLPLLLADKPVKALRLLLPVWGFHFVWFTFPFLWLAFATGLPMAH